jgi:hypothetical protein
MVLVAAVFVLGGQADRLGDPGTIGLVIAVTALPACAVAPISGRWRFAAPFLYLPLLVACGWLVGSYRQATGMHQSIASFGCDAPGGAIDATTLSFRTEGLRVVSGQIQPLEARRHPKKPPAIAVLFKPYGRRIGLYGVRLTSLKSPSEFAARVVYVDGEGRRIERDARVSASLSEPLRFELHWTHRTVALSLGGAFVDRRELDFEPEGLVASCSTSRARFDAFRNDGYELVQRSDAGRFASSHLCDGEPGVFVAPIRTRQGAPASDPVTGVLIANCDSTPLPLAGPETRFALEESPDGTTWNVTRDFTQALCCDSRLGILDANDSWRLDWQPHDLDAAHRFRLVLDSRSRHFYSKIF